MTIAASPTTAGPPVQIYVIRHGEKPADVPTATAAPGPPYGVDVDGNQDPHSLLPRGWQRSGALAVLFAPAIGPLQAGLQTPGTLFSPDYGKPDKTQAHRTYQTVLALSARLNVPIDTPFSEGQESALAQSVVAESTGVVLICWEHRHIPAIVAALPTVPDTQIPTVWPDDRFDLIWSLSLQNETATPAYQFTEIPQQVLAGDAATVATASAPPPRPAV